MFKNYLKGIDGIVDYPMFLLIAFFVFFVSMIIYLWKSDLSRFEELGKIPLQDGSKKFEETVSEQP